MRVDLNCDLGEGYPNDAELMRLISSANVACGFHAGDADTMKRTVELAAANSVAAGAHPSYPDRENFGRTDMDLPVDEIRQIVSDQIGRLDEIASSFGVKLDHVKPHGALYNRSARDPVVAAAIAAAVRDAGPDLVLFGLSGSESIAQAEKLGLRTASEVFADRTYSADGRLTPRSQPNALIESTDDAIRQVMEMVENETVRATDGAVVPIRAETVCLHGDGEHAVEFALALRKELTARGIKIRAVTRT